LKVLSYKFLKKKLKRLKKIKKKRSTRGPSAGRGEPARDVRALCRPGLNGPGQPALSPLI